MLQAYSPVDCVELTFELPDNAKECFHEIIEEGQESTLEFQVTFHLHQFNVFIPRHDWVCLKYDWIGLQQD